MNRRGSLAVLLLAGGSLVGLSGAGPWPARQPEVADGRGGVFLQICAHPDDDLYFLNPDVINAIQAGCPVTTVYLTAGEADGVNAAQDLPHARLKVDFEGYAAARQNGIRAAYAAMVTGDRDSRWRREPHRVGAHELEIATLAAAPQISLVFLNARVTPGLTGPAANRLAWLWTGQRHRQDFLRPTGSPLHAGGMFSREDVLAVLVTLMTELRPTVVRTLDPAPEHLKVTAGGAVTYSDHQDHLYAAYFAHEAARRYQTASRRPVQLQSYRGYFNRYWPRNLDKPTFARKFSYLDTYGWADGHDCGDPVGCGDLQVGGKSRTKQYGRSLNYRYPGTTSWLQPQADGGLTAFAVLGGSVVMWRQPPDGGAWSPPRVLGGGDVVPHLSVVRGPDGRLHVFGARHLLDRSPARHRQSVFCTSQLTAGGPFGPLVDLGNPDGGREAFRALELGLPVGAAGGDGRLMVFARTFERGISMRTQLAEARWSPWRGLTGAGVRDGLVAGTGPGGTVDLYAVTSAALLRWHRSTAQAGFGAPTSILAAPMDGALSAAHTVGAGLGLVIAGQTDGRAITLAGADTVSTIRGHGGTGPVAGLLHDGRLRLARRNNIGGVDISNLHHPGEQPRWTASGGLFTGAPALSMDAAGQHVAATIGVDGNLWLCRLGTGNRPPRWLPANPDAS